MWPKCKSCSSAVRRCTSQICVVQHERRQPTAGHRARQCHDWRTQLVQATICWPRLELMLTSIVVVQHTPCPLPARQRHAALANLRLVSCFQPLSISNITQAASYIPAVMSLMSASSAQASITCRYHSSSNASPNRMFSRIVLDRIHACHDEVKCHQIDF